MPLHKAHDILSKPLVTADGVFETDGIALIMRNRNKSRATVERAKEILQQALEGTQANEREPDIILDASYLTKISREIESSALKIWLGPDCKHPVVIRGRNKDTVAVLMPLIIVAGDEEE